MKLGDFLLGLAFLKGNGRDAVLLVSHQGRDHTPLDSGEQSRDVTYDTPIVNLLQNVGVNKVRGCWLYATYVPSEMDLGMACMRGLAGVVYPSGPETARQRTLDDERGPGAPTAYGGDNDWDLFVSPRGNVAVFDTPWGTRKRWEDRNWLLAWGNRLDPRTLNPNAAAIVASYGKLPDPFFRRPTADIEKLERLVSRGLDTVDCTPLAMLTPEWRDRILMMSAFALVGCSWSSEGRYLPAQRRQAPPTRTTALEGGHNIGALMVNDKNRIIGWSLNVNVINGTFHAETAMVLAYLRRNNVSRLPDGCRIYATLKPCHMCAGFIATVARNVTVVYGQNDPKITHSALDDKRGTGITQTGSALGIGVGTRFGTYTARRNMTVSEALAEMISGSGLNAVPFLYSDLAKRFFLEIRGKPWALDAAIKKFTELPPLSDSLALRGQGRPPEGGLRTTAFLTGQLKPVALPESARGLDLATGLAVIPTPKNPQIPVAQLNRGQVRDMLAQGARVEVTNPSPTLRGLDLAIGNFDVLRSMSRRPDHRTLRTIIDGLGVAEAFLRGLKDKGILSFA